MSRSTELIKKVTASVDRVRLLFAHGASRGAHPAVLIGWTAVSSRIKR